MILPLLMVAQFAHAVAPVVAVVVTVVPEAVGPTPPIANEIVVR